MWLGKMRFIPSEYFNELSRKKKKKLLKFQEVDGLTHPMA